MAAEPRGGSFETGRVAVSMVEPCRRGARDLPVGPQCQSDRRELGNRQGASDHSGTWYDE